MNLLRIRDEDVIAYLAAVNADGSGVKADGGAYAVPAKDGASARLPIPDAEHVAMAITALSPGGFRGQKVELTPEERAEAQRRIAARIQELDITDSTKKHLRERLDALKAAKPDAEDVENDQNEADNPDAEQDEAEDNSGAPDGDQDEDDEDKLHATKAADDLEIVLADTAIKALDDRGRIGGYLVVWGSPYQKDLTGDYFTPQTDFCLDWADRRPALYHHGLDQTAKTTLIGTIESLKTDDVGLWAEAQINKRNKYAQAVQDLVAKGALSWSSGSLPHLVQKDPDGHIKRWPIVEGSLTPTPAEPRYTHITPLKAAVVAYKALNLSTDRIVASQEGAGSGQETAVRADAATKSVSSRIDKPSHTEDIDMDAKELAGLVAAEIARQKEAEAAAIKAKRDEDARIEVRAQEIAQGLKTLPGNRPALPTPPATNPADATKSAPRIEVGEDARYASLSSEDMSFLTHIYTNVVASTPQSSSDNQLYQSALQFIRQARADSSNTLQRQICAKALREHQRGALPDSTLTYLPYKSLDEVWANKYDPAANQAAIKANELDNTAQTGYGLEWVPTIWSNNLWRRVRISNPFAATMQVIEMPSNPYNVPIESTDPTVYFVGEGTDLTMLTLASGNTITLAKVASDKRQMTAKKLGVRVGFSTELVEDSIIPILPIYRYQTQRALENYVDDTIVNGDTATALNTNINLIDGTPTAGTSYLAFDGLRKYALVTNTGQALDGGGGAPTLGLFRQTRGKLLKHYAADIKNLVWVIGWEPYLKMLSMPEFATWQNLGTAGSNVTGLLPNGSPNIVGMSTDGNTPVSPVGIIDGVPVYVSAQIGLAQSTGKISGTPANNTLGSAVLYHRSRWFLGYRRQIALDVFPNSIFSDTYQMWATVRCTIQSFDTQSAAVLYDLAV